jgi:serine/threonine protein kinase
VAFARGDRLGNYEILRRLGEGGMAEIYVARTHVTEGVSRLVALKQLRSVFAGDGELIRMFVDEAKLSAALQHPGIAQVFEVGGASRSPYFAMELVHGETLRALVARSSPRSASAAGACRSRTSPPSRCKRPPRCPTHTRRGSCTATCRRRT